MAMKEKVEELARSVVYDRVATIRHAPLQGVVVLQLLLPPFHGLLRFDLFLFLGTHRGEIIRRTEGRVKPCSLHRTLVTFESVFALLFFTRAFFLEYRQIELREGNPCPRADTDQGKHEQDDPRKLLPRCILLHSSRHGLSL